MSFDNGLNSFAECKTRNEELRSKLPGSSLEAGVHTPELAPGYLHNFFVFLRILGYGVPAQCRYFKKSAGKNYIIVVLYSNEIRHCGN
jgi:hypothetical protein